MPIGAREEGPENGGTPASLAPESKVQGLQTPHGRVCSMLRPGGPSWRIVASALSPGGKGRSFCPSRLKTSGPFSLVA
jgi:hypothetical protein